MVGQPSAGRLRAGPVGCPLGLDLTAFEGGLSRDKQGEEREHLGWVRAGAGIGTMSEALQRDASQAQGLSSRRSDSCTSVRVVRGWLRSRSAGSRGCGAPCARRVTLGGGSLVASPLLLAGIADFFELGACAAVRAGNCQQPLDHTPFAAQLSARPAAIDRVAKESRTPPTGGTGGKDGPTAHWPLHFR
jgi:hypothetical protein